MDSALTLLMGMCRVCSWSVEFRRNVEGLAGLADNVPGQGDRWTLVFVRFIDWCSAWSHCEATGTCQNADKRAVQGAYLFILKTDWL